MSCLWWPKKSWGSAVKRSVYKYEECLCKKGLFYSMLFKVEFVVRSEDEMKQVEKVKSKRPLHLGIMT